MSSNVTQSPVQTETIHLGTDPVDAAFQDLELFIKLVDDELNEDFSANAKTGRVTEKQKQLLPLLSQMITAHATYSLQMWHCELLGEVENRR